MPDQSKPTVVNLRADFAMPTEQPEWWRYRHDVPPSNQAQIDAQGGFLSLPDALANLAPDPWAVEGLIPANSHGCIFGASMTGKTFVAIDIAMSIATGLPWHLSRFRTLRGPVLYLAHESQAGVVKRMAAWCRFHGARMRDETGRLLIPAFILQKPFPFWERSAADSLYVAVQKFMSIHGAPALIVNDTFVRAATPGDENSTRDMTVFLDHCERYVREPARATLLHVHHTGHAAPDRGRGASAIKGAMDFEYRVKAPEEGVIEFACTKQKEHDEEKPLYLRTRSVSLHGYNRAGSDDSSLVVERIDEAYRPERSRRLTERQAAIVAHLRSEYPHTEWIKITEARGSCAVAGLMGETNPYAQWPKIVGALVKKGAATTQGDYIAVADASH